MRHEAQSSPAKESEPRQRTDPAGRHNTVRLACTTAATLALAVATGCGIASVAAPPALATATQPYSGHGELADVAHGKLYLHGGPAGVSRRVTLPGLPYAPAWSADGRWLAVEVSKPPPSGQPYLTNPATLWLVNAAGTSTRRLSPASWQVSDFAWAPRQDELAVAAYQSSAPPARSSLVATLTLAGQLKMLAAAPVLNGPAWSPDGTRLAIGTATFTAGQWHGGLDVLSLAGGPPAVAATSTGNVLELAGWRPDGQGLLYWLDAEGSASLAADGLPLDSVPLGPGTPRTLLPAMLVQGAWLAPSPLGNTFAAVSGGDRVIWSGGKRITLCPVAGRCTPVPQPPGVVSLDPAWSPGGTTLVFARLSASGPFGPGGHAGFSPAWIARWEATSRLWTVSAAQPLTAARPLTAAGPGALDPVWGRDGSLLFVRNDALWLLPLHAVAPTRLTGPLGALVGPAYYRTYYGYVPYPQLFAWTLA